MRGRYGVRLAADRALWRARVGALVVGHAVLVALVWLAGVVVLAVGEIARRAADQADVQGGVMHPGTGADEADENDMRVVPGIVVAVRDVRMTESERA